MRFMLPWLLCTALTAVVLALLAKLLFLQNSLDEISRQLEERLSQDTNNPIFLSARDAHARKLAATLNVQLKELRRQRQRYEHGDRALNEAVTSLAHDLRTPLTAVCGYLELLERRELNPDTARYLSLIGERAEAMKHLTEDLLRYSVAASMEDELRLEPVDLNAAVEEAVASLYGALMEGGVTPSVSLPAQRIMRELNRAALSRVLGNLLTNALKYSDGELEITLTTEGTITLSNPAAALDEVTVGRLFDRFYTVKTGSHSTGLGLSISKALTERMNGTISAQYQAGRLVIRLSFPPPSHECHNR